jgi:hypothetical protein
LATAVINAFREWTTRKHTWYWLWNRRVSWKREYTRNLLSKYNRQCLVPCTNEACRTCIVDNLSAFQKFLAS